jgi:hypothetical protein
VDGRKEKGRTEGGNVALLPGFFHSSINHLILFKSSFSSFTKYSTNVTVCHSNIIMFSTYLASKFLFVIQEILHILLSNQQD